MRGNYDPRRKRLGSGHTINRMIDSRIAQNAKRMSQWLFNTNRGSAFSRVSDDDELDGDLDVSIIGSAPISVTGDSISGYTISFVGGYIQSLGGQTGAVQTLSKVDDTNVTLAIASAANDHRFTLGWTGTLAASRGGTGLSSPGASGNVLTSNGAGAWVSSAPSSGNHNLLSATHPDTTAASVLRGSIITGQGASPAWARFALGTTNHVLQSNGTDLIYGLVSLANSVTGILPYSSVGGGTVAAIPYFDSSGNLTYDAGNLAWQDGAGATDSFLIIGNGNLSAGFFRGKEKTSNGSNRHNVHFADAMAANFDWTWPGSNVAGFFAQDSGGQWFQRTFQVVSSAPTDFAISWTNPTGSAGDPVFNLIITSQKRSFQLRPCDSDTAPVLVAGNGSSLTFPDAATTSAYFVVHLPDNYDGGTFLATVDGYAAAIGIPGNCKFELSMGAGGDNTPWPPALGTAQNVTTAVGIVREEQFTFPAVTAAGTPVAGNVLWIKLSRLGADAADTRTAQFNFTHLHVEYGITAMTE